MVVSKRCGALRAVLHNVGAHALARWEAHNFWARLFGYADSEKARQRADRCDGPADHSRQHYEGDSTAVVYLAFTVEHTEIRTRVSTQLQCALT